MVKLAFLGLGAMGSRMAHNLLREGYPLTVFNRSCERTAPLVAAGATAAATPRDAVEGADIVISMVRDDEASREVWLTPETGAIHSLRPGMIAVEASTLTPAWVEALAVLVSAAGAEFVDAPVVGTLPQVEARQLIVLAGGAEAAVSRVRQVLASTAGAIHHLGPVGSGSVMKLAVNALYGVQVAVWAEMLALLERRGMEAAQSVELLNSLPTTSPALQVAGKLMATASYAPLFPIDLVDKDLGYARTLARGLGVSSPILAAAHEVYAEARERGYGGDNIAGVKQLYDLKAPGS